MGMMDLLLGYPFRVQKLLPTKQEFYLATALRYSRQMNQFEVAESLIIKPQ